MCKLHHLLLVTGVLVLLASGCQVLPQQLFNGAAQDNLFVPPTRAAVTSPIPTSLPLPTPTPAPVAAAVQPTPTLQCVDSLLFIDDLTVPDGSQVAAGSSIDKRWQVENNGSCNWDKRYLLKLIAGEPLGSQVEYSLFPARSGTQASLRIIFTAPETPGGFRSAWQAYNPAGEPFGDPVFIEIEVFPTTTE